MKTQRNILVAFFLNLAFAVFELVGGILTGSVAVASDAVHDIGDAASIGVSYFMERKSKKQPDENYTYGYGRYSVLGGVITTVILLVGSAMVIYNAVYKLIIPTPVHYDGMIIFAIVGVAVNFFAAWFTREGDSVNQKAVNLHMLEDVLGWAVVLVGAVIMRFTDLVILDPLMSIGVAVFILINALKNLSLAMDPILEKKPRHISAADIQTHVGQLEEVLDVHHIHLWSMDGSNSYATMHIVYQGDPVAVKAAVRRELQELGIVHTTLELETEGEVCSQQECHVEECSHSDHHHHHHHHH